MGRIEIIIGCMFSGKSSELIRRVKRYEAINIKVLSINYDKDNRYGNSNQIITHDKTSKNALSINKLRPILGMEEFKKSSIIAINEGQFFEDLYDFVTTAADYFNKTIIVCGLDGDYQRNVFGDILRLIPHSESVQKIDALCKLCQDGTKAWFTKRISHSNQTIEIGGSESYIPVCRAHYNSIDEIKNTIENELSNK
jgi:thymidine kinase